MQPIRYEVKPQGKLFAVRRHGKQGGMRLIVVYANKYTADSICTTLQAHAPMEK